MISLALYYTSHCHLCEEAESLLDNISPQYDIQWTKIDIANHDTLLAKYATIIPVIQRQDNLKEIHWPFTTSILVSFLNSQP